MGCCDEHRKVLPEFELPDKICPIINQRIEFLCFLLAWKMEYALNVINRINIRMEHTHE